MQCVSVESISFSRVNMTEICVRFRQSENIV